MLATVATIPPLSTTFLNGEISLFCLLWPCTSRRIEAPHELAAQPPLLLEGRTVLSSRRSSYLDEDTDAQEIEAAIKKEGRKCVAVPGDIRDEGRCRKLVERAAKEFGKIDVLVNNAAYQVSRERIEDITTEEFDRIFKTNAYALFWLCRAAMPHMPKRATARRRITSSLRTRGTSREGWPGSGWTAPRYRGRGGAGGRWPQA
jgi:NAD(P)-dependent dehydrogenase (short-subunit alcohol dehydrogenase family)